MLTIWYFDADPIGSTPEHVYTGQSEATAYEALCDRFGAELFDESEIDSLFAEPSGGFVIELPAGSRCAVIKH